MRVYLAARYSTHPTMRAWRVRLAAAGIAVISRWINGDHEGRADEDRRRFAAEDLEDLRMADVVIAWNPIEHHGGGRGGGRHVEFGYALALGLPIVLVGAREHVFHWCPEVVAVADLEAAIAVLTAPEVIA